MIALSDINIRTELRPGDIGHITYLHGDLYRRECGYGIEFEVYVAETLSEFCRNYNPVRSRAWICEHEEKRVGFMVLVDRGDAAQLRYFLILPEYRGIGLGNKLMTLFMEFAKACGYSSAYLWTTAELDTAAHLYTKYGFMLTESHPSSDFGKSVVQNRYEVTW